MNPFYISLSEPNLNDFIYFHTLNCFNIKINERDRLRFWNSYTSCQGLGAGHVHFYGDQDFYLFARYGGSCNGGKWVFGDCCFCLITNNPLHSSTEKVGEIIAYNYKFLMPTTCSNKINYS